MWISHSSQAIVFAEQIEVKKQIGTRYVSESVLKISRADPIWPNDHKIIFVIFLHDRAKNFFNTTVLNFNIYIFSPLLQDERLSSDPCNGFWNNVTSSATLGYKIVLMGG